MKKAIFATIAAAIATLSIAAHAQQQVTRCQWEGYGQYKQWVCRNGY